MRCVAVLIFCETSAWNAVSLLHFSLPQAIAPPLLSVNTQRPTHPHGTVSNSAASGSACVNREQQHFPNLSQTQTSSLPFPSIHLFLLCHTLSQSSPPCSGHCALILPLPPSILVALSYHFGMSPSSSNPFALPSIPDVQHPYSCSLSLYYCQSSEACSQTLLKHSSPVCWLIYLLFCLTVPCLRHFLSVKQGNQPCLLWHTSCSPTKLIFNHRLSKSKTAKVLVKRKNKN